MQTLTLQEWLPKWYEICPLSLVCIFSFTTFRPYHIACSAGSGQASSTQSDFGPSISISEKKRSSRVEAEIHWGF